MNSTATRAIVAAFGIIISLWLAYSVFSHGGNTLGNTSRKLVVIGFLLGLFVPKISLGFFFVTAGYSGLLKRLLVVEGRFGGFDIVAVLAIGPAVLLGLSLNFLFRIIVGSYVPKKRDFLLFGAAMLFNVLTIVSGVLTTGSPLAAMKMAVDQSAGAVFLFVVPLLFPTREAFLRACQMILIVFLPSAAYGIFQRYGGLQDFEVLYLESGFSINVEALGLQLDGLKPRPFSTMSSGCYGMVMMICTVIALFGVIKPKGGGASLRSLPYSILPSVILAIFYFIAFFHGFNRSTWACFVMVIGLTVFFRSKLTLIFGYASILIPLGILMGTSEIIVEQRLLERVGLEIASAFQLEEGTSLEQSLRVGTYAARLEGFAAVFGNTEAWTLFGMNTEDREKFEGTIGASHDLLTGSLLRLGAIPVFMFILLLVYAVYRTHRYLLEILLKHELDTCNLILGTAIAVIITSVASGNLFSIFPTSHLIFFLLGGLVVFSAEGRRLSLMERVRPCTVGLRQRNQEETQAAAKPVLLRPSAAPRKLS